MHNAYKIFLLVHKNVRYSNISTLTCKPIPFSSCLSCLSCLLQPSSVPAVLPPPARAVLAHPALQFPRALDPIRHNAFIFWKTCGLNCCNSLGCLPCRQVYTGALLRTLVNKSNNNLANAR